MKEARRRESDEGGGGGRSIQPQRSAAAPAAHLSSVFQVHGVSQAHMHGASHARALACSSGFLLCVHLAFRDDCQTEHEADSSRLQFLFSFF